MNKKILFLFVFFLFPLVIAQPPSQTNVNTNVGLTIDFPIVEVVKANQTETFNFHVFNISDGLRLDNSSVICRFHLYNLTGFHVIETNMSFVTIDNDWEIDVLGGNFSDLGKYSIQVNCNDGGFGGFIVFSFDVTESGFLINEGNSNILFAIILFMMVLGTIFIMGFFKKESKFQVKWTFFVVGYILFLSALTLTQISLRDSLVNPLIIDFIDTFLAVGFILFWFAFGLLIVIWIITTLQTLLFNKIQKNMERFE